MNIEKIIKAFFDGIKTLIKETGFHGTLCLTLLFGIGLVVVILVK